nr:hypothetical protein [Lichenihabitans sp. PAMC28606]
MVSRSSEPVSIKPDKAFCFSTKTETFLLSTSIFKRSSDIRKTFFASEQQVVR